MEDKLKAPKNGCFQTVVLEKALESPLDCKEIKPVNSKGNQSCIFTGRTDAEAPILWPPDGKIWFIRKDPDAGKDWRQEEKEMTEDEMVGWYHWINGHEFEQALGVGDELIDWSTWHMIFILSVVLTVNEVSSRGESLSIDMNASIFKLTFS